MMRVLAPPDSTADVVAALDSMGGHLRHHHPRRGVRGSGGGHIGDYDRGMSALWVLLVNIVMLFVGGVVTLVVQRALVRRRA